MGTELDDHGMATTLSSLNHPEGPERIAVARLLPPVTPPSIMCVGLNYRRHAKEVGMDVPRFPVVFHKSTGSTIADGETIVIPACASDHPEVDYECELAVVIGEPAKDVTVEQALDHVWGYTVANDVSARRWQGKKGGGQWCFSKSFDTFCPLGPSIALAHAVPDPQNLQIRTEVNGKVVSATCTVCM